MTSTEALFHMSADSLLSKWGFGDGDGLNDWWWDNYDEDPPFNADEALYALALTYLVPEIRKAGYEVELTRIGTIHNPVRIEHLSGVEVDWYTGDNTFEPPIEVSVTREQIENAALLREGSPS